MFSLLFIFCLASFFVTVLPYAAAVDDQEQSSDLVQISVLFEALCPDSIAFVVGPLADAHAKFERYIRLELVPFGKATINKNNEIICQHGKYECQINKFLSCVIRYMENPLPYIVCLEQQLPLGEEPTDWKQMAQDCYLQKDIVSNIIAEIRDCADGPEGNALQLAAGKQTRAIRPDRMTFVPWILWDNASFANVQERSRTDLKPLICNQITKANIGQCANVSTDQSLQRPFSI